MEKGKRSVRLMGTVIETVIWHPNPEPVLDQVEELLYLYRDRFSANDLTSELMEVNLNAGVQPVPVAADLYELIECGKRHSLAEGSFLNITIGPLVQAWRIGFSDAERPSKEVIENRLALISPRDIDLDPEHQLVYLKKEGMAIDLGALAKGYVADRIVAFLKAMGAHSGYINLGGNVCTFGWPVEHEGSWKIGVQDPQKERGHFLAQVLVEEGSVVTSGIYERTLTIEGKVYHHVLDSQTGYPLQSELASLTILSPHSVDGEIWTSRLFGYGPDQVLDCLGRETEFAAILIDKDNRLYASKSLKGRLFASQPIHWEGEDATMDSLSPQGIDVLASASQGGFGARQWSDTVSGASAT